MSAGRLAGRSCTWNSPRSTKASAAASRSSSTRRSTPMSTSGRRPASSPPTSCSRRWATRAISASTSPPSTAAWASTTPTSSCSSRRSATSRLRRRADGDRRADRHGDARARPLRLRGAVQGVPRSFDQGRLRRLPRRVGGRRRLRRRLHQDHRQEGRRRLRHQRRQDVDHERHPGRLDVPARQHRRTGRRTRTSRSSASP